MESAIPDEPSAATEPTADRVVSWPIVVALLGLTLAGAALRLVGLSAKSYWQDEIATVLVLEHGFSDAMAAVAHDQNTPPFYYLVAWPWAHTFGTGEVALRSFSAVLSVALIPVAFLVGRELLSSRVGLITAALVATNPLLVWYGQDAKAYALLSLLMGLSFLFFLRALDRATTARLLAWATLCALAVATHYFAAFLVAVEAVWLFWASRTRVRVAVAAAIPFLTGVALLPLLAVQGDPGWVDEIGLAGRVLKTPIVFVVGFEAPAPYAVTGVAVVICAVGLWLLLARSTPYGRGKGLLALGVGTASLVVALIGADYFIYRNVIAALLPILAGLACGFGAARAGRLGVAAAAVLCVFSCGVALATAHTPKFGKEDWRDAAGAVASGGDKAIVLTPDDGRLPMFYYLRGTSSLLDGPGVRVSEIAVVAGAVRTLGSIAAARPPADPTRPAPPGFEVRSRVDARYYTVITYRAPAKRWVSRRSLLALALDEEPALIISRS